MKGDPILKMCQDLKDNLVTLAGVRLCSCLSPDSVATSRVQDLSDMVEILI